MKKTNVGFSNKVLADVDNLMDSFVAVLPKSPIRLRSHLLLLLPFPFTLPDVRPREFMLFGDIMFSYFVKNGVEMGTFPNIPDRSSSLSMRLSQGPESVLNLRPGITHVGLGPGITHVGRV